MTDLIARLREQARRERASSEYYGSDTLAAVLDQAADALEAQARELKEAREFIASCKRGHYFCDDSWYSCPKSEDGCADEREGTECNCDADEWNAKVDAMLAALDKVPHVEMGGRISND